jgi:predicted outer membrane repeat protein
VFWEGGGLYITGCTFTSNKAKSTDTDKGGGAIYFQTTLDSKIGNAELPVFSITGSTFTTNTSNYGGDIQTTDGIEDTGSYT